MILLLQTILSFEEIQNTPGMAFLMAFQSVGLMLLYYSSRIFQEAGLGESTALLSSIGIGW
jgi:hypothetical protein